MSKLAHLRATRKLISDTRTATQVDLFSGSGPGGRCSKSIRPDQISTQHGGSCTKSEPRASKLASSPMEYRKGWYGWTIRANKFRVFDPENKGRLAAASAGNRLKSIRERVPYQIQSSHRSLLDHHSHSGCFFVPARFVIDGWTWQTTSTAKYKPNLTARSRDSKQLIEKLIG